MTLLEKIKTAALGARKARDVEKASLLTTLLGEIETLAKNGKSTSDTDVQAIVKKFVKNIDETLQHVQGEAQAKFLAERQVLSAFLPQQLSELELTGAINSIIKNGAKNVGEVMKALKTDFGGRYDGAMANKLIKELL